MSKYKVLGGVWGEGWTPGTIVDMDTDAARTRLMLGELEAYFGEAPSGVSSPVVEPVVEDVVVVEESSGEVTSEPKKRGRPRKEVAGEETSEPVAEEVAAPTEETGDITNEDVTL